MASSPSRVGKGDPRARDPGDGDFGGGDPGDAARHLRNALGALAVAVSDLLAEDAEARDLNPAENAAVILVGTLDGLSQEDLQRRLGLSQPGTTRLVDRLVARGLLIRTPGPDRRTNALRLTGAGVAEARRALDHRHKLLGPLTADLTENEQQAAIAVIDQILTTLIRSGRPGWRICRQCDRHDCEGGQYRCPTYPVQQSMQADPPVARE